ncbi:MAG TPA: prepilin peptidase [Candidatus Nanoarchaeia archaeon]|nr:prepilin peptidase [Candidatus Nanoarchaeia archaeon]
MFYLFIIFSLAVGAVIGSFTNCFVWRLRENETLWDRSYCPKCRKMIAWFDNIPVLSFFILKGHCRQCGKKISWQYPLVELSTACLFAAAFYFSALAYNGSGNPADDFYLLFGNAFIIELVKEWLIIFILTAIFIYDLRWYLIPDQVAIPAALLIFPLDILLGYNWIALLAYAVIGGGFFLLQFLVSRGKWVGGGDIRLGILLGLIAGSYQRLILAILLTYCIGSVVSIFLVVWGKKQWSSKVPLGVFMAPALIITMFWGQQIVNWYANLFWPF